MNLYGDIKEANTVSSVTDTYNVKTMEDSDLLSLYYSILDDVETGQWNSSHSLLPAIEEELDARGLTPVYDESEKKINEETPVEYFNERFKAIHDELTELKQKAEDSGYKDLVYGIDKILETWENDAIVA